MVPFSRAILWGRSLNGFALFLSLINVRHSMITSLVREASGRQKDDEKFSATLIEHLKAWKSLSLLLEDIWSACFSSKGQSAWTLITKPSDLRLWCHHGFLLSQSSSSPALSTQPEQAMRCHRHHKEWFFTAFLDNMIYCNSSHEWLLGGFPFWYWNGGGVVAVKKANFII